MSLSKSPMAMIYILSWAGLARSLLSASSVSNATSWLAKSPTSSTNNSRGSTRLEPVSLSASLMSLGSTQGTGQFTTSLSTTEIQFVQVQKVSDAISQTSIDARNATNSSTRGVETQVPRASADGSTAHQLDLASGLWHNETTTRGVHVTQTTLIPGTRENNTALNSTTYDLETQNRNTTSMNIDSWSRCTKSTYATDWPVSLRSLSPECDQNPNLEAIERLFGRRDMWSRYDYVDRCLARWCWNSWASAISTHTGPLTEYYPHPLTWMNFSSKLITKSTLTASDEDSLYWNYTYGPLESTTFMSTYIGAPGLQRQY